MLCHTESKRSKTSFTQSMIVKINSRGGGGGGATQQPWNSNYVLVVNHCMYSLISIRVSFTPWNCKGNPVPFEKVTQTEVLNNYICSSVEKVPPNKLHVIGMHQKVALFSNKTCLWVEYHHKIHCRKTKSKRRILFKYFCDPLWNKRPRNGNTNVGWPPISFVAVR